MSRNLSLNVRKSIDAAYSDEFPIVLIEFNHASLAKPIRLSTDPTERISDDPIRYATRSRWRGADPATEPFLFVAAGLEMPGDQEDAPAAFQITVDLFDAELVKLLRSFNRRATANLALVWSSDPSSPEQQWLGLEATSSKWGAQVVITSSRKPIEEEAAPMDIIGKQRFPGLFR
ncbi:hypothetical protein [Salipiger thiooxidans]|uniref:hypothetical protein n=1 Tax=Salipiger thiooxidans TaxID=282683 RepID=UPI001CD3FE92|nr:hypothetical protein [Salipiger thiooxidans]MCA0851302.1 hypothetical protein [Salipiger thiooxidans]